MHRLMMMPSFSNRMRFCSSAIDSSARTSSGCVLLAVPNNLPQQRQSAVNQHMLCAMSPQVCSLTEYKPTWCRHSRTPPSNDSRGEARVLGDALAPYNHAVDTGS